jgi:hypothetical protein
VQRIEGVIVRAQVQALGGGSYQILINDALRQHVEGKRPTLEQTLRRVVREKLARPRRRARGSREFIVRRAASRSPISLRSGSCAR